MPVRQQSRADALLARLRAQRTTQQLTAIAKLLAGPVQSRRSDEDRRWEQNGSLAGLRDYHLRRSTGRIPGVPRRTILHRRSAQERERVRKQVITDREERPKLVVGIKAPRTTRGKSPLCRTLTRHPISPGDVPATGATVPALSPESTPQKPAPAVDDLRMSGALMCLAVRKSIPVEQRRKCAINRNAMRAERSRMNSGPPPTPTTPSPPGRRCLVEPAGPRSRLCVTAPAPPKDPEREARLRTLRMHEQAEVAWAQRRAQPAFGIRGVEHWHNGTSTRLLVPRRQHTPPAPPRTPTIPARAMTKKEKLDRDVTEVLETLLPL